VASFVLIRPVVDADLPQLQALADHLDTVNLPDDPVVLKGIIADSARSFAGLTSTTPSKADPKHAGFTLVAVEVETVHGVVQGERLLGTASVFAYHGMPDEPRNAHAHIAAMLLGAAQVVPVVDGVRADPRGVAGGRVPRELRERRGVGLDRRVRRPQVGVPRVPLVADVRGGAQ